MKEPAEGYPDAGEVGDVFDLAVSQQSQIDDINSAKTAAEMKEALIE
jgi:hypothetical protein